MSGKTKKDPVMELRITVLHIFRLCGVVVVLVAPLIPGGCRAGLREAPHRLSPSAPGRRQPWSST